MHALMERYLPFRMEDCRRGHDGKGKRGNVMTEEQEFYDERSAYLSDGRMGWHTRTGFAVTILLVTVLFYILLFIAALPLGIIAAIIEIGFRIAAPMDILVEITGAVLGLAAGGLVILAGIDRLEDMGASAKWLIPGILAWLVFVISETGLFPAPDRVVSAAILTVAASVVVLCLWPGRKRVEPPLEGGKYLMIGEKMIKID